MDPYNIRYQRLNQVVKKALEQTIKKTFAMEQLSKAFPTIASIPEGKRSLESARAQIVDFCYSISMKEFMLIFEESDVENKLNQLDEIIHTAQKRRQEGSSASVHFDRLAATEIMNASLVPAKKSAMESLTLIYNQLKADNDAFAAELRQICEESDEIRLEMDTVQQNVAEIQRYNVEIDQLLADVLE